MKKFKIILAVIFVPIIGLVVAGALLLNSFLSTVVEDNFDKNYDLMINEDIKKNKDVLNIALFGVDCRTEGYEGCRSDVMMILSYNKKSNDIAVTSVARDTYVEIGNQGFDKINHAYAFGGPELSIQTMNRAFDLNISQYVTVDFWIVEDIINALNGVDVNVSSAEVSVLNDYIWDLNQNAPDGSQEDYLRASGIQTLTGRQAVAYMRIRYVGDGDFERMQRQRTVMDAALSKLNTLEVSDVLGLVNNLLPGIKTNISKGEIISLATSVMTKGFPIMEQSQLPARNGGVGKMINGVYYFVPNTLLSNVEAYHNLIYPNEEYNPSSNVIEMSESLKKYLY